MELGMDKKEEGEISLDDVSSPEEVPQYSASWWTRSQRTENSRIHGRREVDIPLQDAVHGKENRRHARGNFSATKYTVAKLQEKNDLLPISSDEEVEYVGLPGSSYQLPIRCGKKRRKKKKKKKGNGGDGNLSINDYVSLVDSDPDIIPINMNKEIIPPRRSPSPVFKRRRSPVGKSREYSARSPPKSYCPNYRYRMEIRHSRSTSPKRKSPRKFRSPRRSPSNTSYGGSSPDLKRKKNHHMPDGYDELYATSLLKRVRRLDGVGTLGSVLQQKAKEGPSLKEKLIMMENHSDVNAETVGVKKENEMKPEKIVKNETEGEEDLEILRRQALETKKSGEEVSDSKAESIVDGNDESAGKNQIERQDGTDDLEDLELRLIALRSAMIKKYQDRVKKGGPKKIKTHREESPFSDSYLFQNTKDEQSGSEKSSSSWSPMSQSPDYPESIAPSPKVEGMEECEIDIDSPPYSPTDDVMSQSQMEYELAERKRKLFEENSHNEITDTDYIVPEFETPYSPSGMHTSDKNSSSSGSINGNLDIEDNSSFERLVGGDPEIPYSPTDPLFTLPCDLEMAKSSESFESTPQIIEKHSPIKKIPNKPEVEKHPLDEDLSKLMPLEFLRDGSMSPNDSLITIDEIQEIQEEQHLPVGNSEPKNLLLNIANNSVRKEDNNIDEPLYLQGVPDVTKDVNKIPTLVNKSLVPATILKTNKKLQQPLPSKKLDPVVEPAFISATMQPVDFDIGKSISSNAVFKPIKLQPVLKKPVAIASPAAVFNTLLINEENTREIKKENDSKIAENIEGNIQKINVQEIVPPLVKDNPGNQIIEGDVKKKKKSHTRKSSCRKNLQKIQKKLDESSILMRGENHGDSSKINKQDVGKLTKNLCHKKSDEKNKKNDEMKEKELRERLEAKRKRRSKSTHRSEKYEKHSKQNVKNDIVIEKNDGKTSDGKDNEKPLGIMKSKKSEKDKKIVEEKRRRASMDDDEETLRALLLASLPKRQKPVEAKVPEPQIKIPENVEKKTIEEEFKKPTVSVENLPKTSATVSRVVLPVGKSLSPNNFIVSVPNITNSINTIEKATIPLSEVPEGKKRTATVIVNPAPTKVLRKVTIPVNSILSNNTKTMQNTLNQKNMALQNTQNILKAPTTIISTHRNMTVNNVKINENIRPSSPKLFSSRNCRLVINLGEDSDTDSDPSSEQQSNEPKESTALPEPDFEKSLEAFLKDQRKKQESVAATSKPMTSTPVPTIKPSSSKKLTGLASTPLAVRHLSASRQEEYRRLKQQILERERQKLHRTIESSLQSLGNKINSTSLTPPGPLSPASPINKPNKLSPVVKTLGSDVKQIGTNVQDSPIVDKKNAQIIEKTVEENTSISNSTSVTECSKEIMKNLSIQIPNDNKAAVETPSVENKNVSEKENVNTKEVPVQNTPVLKILTSDQVNMKFSDNILPHLVEENVRISSCQTSIVKTSDREPETCQIANENSPIGLSENENPKSSSMDMDTLEASDRPIEPSRISSLTKESNLEPGIDNPNETIVLDDSQMEECSVKEEQINNEPIGEILGTPVNKSPTKSKRNKSPSKELSEKIKSDVKVEMESFTSLCEDEQKEKLIEIEGQLVAQRYAVLDDLTQMTHTLKQWDIERELQTRMATEVRQLRNQLKVAEERLKKQRKIISQMGPKVIESHVTIINHRAECHKLTKLCQGIGQKVAGQDYKVPSTCQQLMIDTLKKVAFHTRQLSQKKLPSIEPNKQTNKICDSEQKIVSSEVRENLRTMRLSGDSDHSIDSQSNQSDDVLVNNLIRQNDQCDSPSGEVNDRSNEGNSDFSTLNEDTCLPNGSSIPCASEKINKETSNAHEKSRVISNSNSDDDGESTRPVSTYKSVLTGFQSLRHIDPNGVLCPYEMMGVCGDEGCPYNHLDTNRKRG